MERELAFLEGLHRGVLATLMQDGRPQLSNVAYACGDGLVRISTRDGLAKVANVRRDPRVSLHVTTPDFRPYVVAEGVARVGPPASGPDDDTVEELVAVYRHIAGEHPDWTEFRRAMVADRRLVLRFRIDRVYPRLG